jgi:enamine deaminase RidA (YjgF/YER057c/UK114 family)
MPLGFIVGYVIMPAKGILQYDIDRGRGKLKPEQMIRETRLRLPRMQPPAASFVPVRKVGNLVYVSGHAPVDECGNTCVTGKVGREISVQEGYQAARLAAMACLSSLRTAVGSLDSIRGIVKVAGFVNSVEGLEQQPQVVNGASDLLVEIFGDQGRHARSAIGVASLPGNIPVEIEMIAEV